MNWYKHIVRRRYNSETIFSGKFKDAIYIYLEIIQYYCHFPSSKDTSETFCLTILNTMWHWARLIKVYFVGNTDFNHYVRSNFECSPPHSDKFLRLYHCRFVFNRKDTIHQYVLESRLIILNIKLYAPNKFIIMC